MKLKRHHLLFLLAATVFTATMPRYSFAQADITASITSGHNDIYANQTFNITLTIVSRNVRLGKHLSLGQLSKNPSVQLISDFKEIPIKRIQNKEIRQFRCEARATKPGQILFNPALEAGILNRRRAFIGYQWVQEIKRVKVAPLTLFVKPIPESGRPIGFSGAVGKYSFDVTISPTNVAVGDIVTAVSKVTGSGYLEKMAPPRFSPGKHFKVYDPELIKGSSPRAMSFSQTLVPQSTKAIAVPEISFSYFDPYAKTFKTITRGPFILNFRAHADNNDKPYRPPEVTATADTNEVSLKPIAETEEPISLINRIRASIRSFPTATVKTDSKARLAPSASSVNTFDIASGSKLEVVELLDNWAKVSFKNKRGWIPLSDLTR